MGSIFLSFVHEEEFSAGLMHAFLREIFGEKIDVFLSADRTAIYAGDDWMAKIFERLKATTILISLLSPESIKRPWINFEAGAAWMRDAKVIPVCFRGLGIGSLPKPYSTLQAIQMDTEAGAHYLVSSVAHHLALETPRASFFEYDSEEIKPINSPYRRLIDLFDRDREQYEASIASDMLEILEGKEKLSRS